MILGNLGSISSQLRTHLISLHISLLRMEYTAYFLSRRMPKRCRIFHQMGLWFRGIIPASHYHSDLRGVPGSIPGGSINFCFCFFWSPFLQVLWMSFTCFFFSPFFLLTSSLCLIFSTVHVVGIHAIRYSITCFSFLCGAIPALPQITSKYIYTTVVLHLCIL